jgi:hypothetical protein
VNFLDSVCCFLQQRNYAIMVRIGSFYFHLFYYFYFMLQRAGFKPKLAEARGCKRQSPDNL